MWSDSEKEFIDAATKGELFLRSNGYYFTIRDRNTNNRLNRVAAQSREFHVEGPNGRTTNFVLHTHEGETSSSTALAINRAHLKEVTRYGEEISRRFTFGNLPDLQNLIPKILR